MNQTPARFGYAAWVQSNPSPYDPQYEYWKTNQDCSASVVTSLSQLLNGATQWVYQPNAAFQCQFRPVTGPNAHIDVTCGISNVMSATTTITETCGHTSALTVPSKDAWLGRIFERAMENAWRRSVHVYTFFHDPRYAVPVSLLTP